jgi:hypothetical protein
LKDKIFKDDDIWVDLEARISKTERDDEDDIFIEVVPFKTEINWTLFVFTSNLSRSGTDADVYLHLTSDIASTTRLHLDKTKTDSKNPFEKGSCDRFDFKIIDIGDPTQITIGHNDKGLLAGWHLEKLILVDIDNRRKFQFNCNQWIGNENKSQITLNREEEEGEKETINKYGTKKSNVSFNNNNESQIYIKSKSTNSLENIEKGMTSLSSSKLSPKKKGSFFKSNTSLSSKQQQQQQHLEIDKKKNKTTISRRLLNILPSSILPSKKNRRNSSDQIHQTSSSSPKVKSSTLPTGSQLYPIDNFQQKQQQERSCSTSSAASMVDAESHRNGNPSLNNYHNRNESDSLNTFSSSIHHHQIKPKYNSLSTIRMNQEEQCAVGHPYSNIVSIIHELLLNNKSIQNKNGSLSSNSQTGIFEFSVQVELLTLRFRI